MSVPFSPSYTVEVYHSNGKTTEYAETWNDFNKYVYQTPDKAEEVAKHARKFFKKVRIVEAKAM